MSDEQFMARALQLAQRGIYTTDPNPRVGCVLVKDGVILAEGWHQWAGQAHAEVHALSQLSDPAAARGATAYVTLEPCSHIGRTGPCCDALLAAGIQRVVAAMQDPNPQVAGRGLERLRAGGVSVECGLLQTAAEQLNRGFIKRMTQGLPFVTSKIAMSLDGRTALANGESQWITGAEARADVHRLRAESSAILTGIDTVLQDDPRLDARVDWPLRPPVKVVLDSRLRLPASAKLISTPGETWVVTLETDLHKHQPLIDAGCQIWVVSEEMGHVSLADTLALLARKAINHVWIEAGARLNGALLKAGCVDEWIIYMAPCVLGDSGRGVFHFSPLKDMSEKIMMKLLDTRPISSDLKLIYGRS